MLSGHESSHCMKILRLLDEESLYSLKDTITRGAIVVSNQQETRNAIVEYSSNVTELLTRRKLKREVLLKYLIQERVRIDPSASKEVIIQAILKYIKSTGRDVNLNSLSLKSAARVTADDATQSNIEKSAANFYTQNVGRSIAETDQQIAKEFISWFYPMLNSLTGKLNQLSDASVWSIHHFWPECRMRCKLPVDETGKEFTFETYEGSKLCEKRLASFVTELHLVFNANDTPSGYRGRINKHGMAKVLVCGTVHKCEALGGLKMFATFEQIFGLLKDPIDDNRWKIKFTDLSMTLITDGGHSVPCLSITSVKEIMQD